MSITRDIIAIGAAGGPLVGSVTMASAVPHAHGARTQAMGHPDAAHRVAGGHDQGRTSSHRGGGAAGAAVAGAAASRYDDGSYRDPGYGYGGNPSYGYRYESNAGHAFRSDGMI